MDINITKLSDKEIAGICLKYNIIQVNEFKNYTREQVVNEIQKWVQYKKNTYRQRRHSSPNIPMNTPEKQTDNKIISSQPTLKRSTSQQFNIQKTNNPTTSPPKPTVNRERRMSEPFTEIEKDVAREDHQAKKSYNNHQDEIKNIVQHSSLNQDSHMNKYDQIGIYPKVRRLIAVGDLHGDLRVTLIALRLAKVIPDNIFPYNVDKISWCGGDTWVIQLGDQIDRCRPDNWKKNCIEDFDDVIEDEGNNMMIIQLFQNLDTMAKKQGGRVLGMIGNHELMNIDRDFRYVSPKEFLEFVPPNERNRKYTDDGYPYGYYHRLKVFERGGNIAKHYAIQKKSITVIGKNLFVHGGLSHDLMNKYSIHEINSVVQKWLLKQCSDKEDKIFDEIFRDDDDMSPFWCRLYSEDDGYGENTEQGYNELLKIINSRNKLIEPISRVVVAHTPQFMEDKYMNSLYGERLWRIDVGMSRAFGQHDNCGDNKYRQIQVLEILDDKVCNRLMASYQGRQPCEGIGENVDMGAGFLG
tara:strand:+ start:21059 stop:22630 length:1572 start_codon:yes stop_codon:yes gene_type:complete